MTIDHGQQPFQAPFHVEGVAEQQLGRHILAQITRARTHVAVREFEPRSRKGVRERFGIGVEAPRDLLVGRIEAQREVRGEHGRGVPLGRVVGIGNRAGPGAADLLCCWGCAEPGRLRSTYEHHGVLVDD